MRLLHRSAGMLIHLNLINACPYLNAHVLCDRVCHILRTDQPDFSSFLKHVWVKKDRSSVALSILILLGCFTYIFYSRAEVLDENFTKIGQCQQLFGLLNKNRLILRLKNLNFFIWIFWNYKYNSYHSLLQTLQVLFGLFSFIIQEPETTSVDWWIEAATLSSNAGLIHTEVKKNNNYPLLILL